MCFQILSPNGPLEINYYDEDIALRLDRSTRISVDLILTNRGATPLPKVLMIYPRALREQSRRNRSELENEGFVPLRDFRDENETYFERGSRRSEWLRRRQIDVEEGHDEQGSYVTYKEAGSPNRRGYVDGTVAAGLWSELNSTELKILCDPEVNASILELRFSRQIKPGESRALRFSLWVYDVTPRSISIWNLLYLWWTDQARYHYQASGPTTVQHNLTEKLERVLKYGPNGRQVEGSLVRMLPGLVEKVREFRTGDTFFLDGRLVIRPRYFGELHSITHGGDLVEQREFPSYHKPSGGLTRSSQPLYEWRWGDRAFPGKWFPEFQLGFFARPPGAVSRLVPLIARGASILFW